MKCPFVNKLMPDDFNNMCIRYAGIREFYQDIINHSIFLRNLEAYQM